MTITRRPRPTAQLRIRRAGTRDRALRGVRRAGRSRSPSARCCSWPAGGRTTSGARGEPRSAPRPRPSDARAGDVSAAIDDPSRAPSRPRPVERGGRRRHAALARHRARARRRARVRVGQATLADTYNLANIDAEHRLRAARRRRAVGHARSGVRRAPRDATTTARRPRSSPSTMTALAIFTAVAMLFAPLIARLFALDTHAAPNAPRSCT